jgi:hypothetical protein
MNVPSSFSPYSVNTQQISIERHVHFFESLMKTYCLKPVTNTDNVVDDRTSLSSNLLLALCVVARHVLYIEYTAHGS